ncbi:MAG TPA: MATE family efflux transporter [Roseiarcus sp.]|nr:MATE family efflux transporter [Roseiarcus sp.]
MNQAVRTETLRAPSSPWLVREAAAAARLGWPLVLANIATNAMNVTDIMMLGWLSPGALAAGALGFNLYLPLLIFGIGVVSASAPIVARMIGADPRDREGPRRAAHHTFVSAIALCLPTWIVLWNSRAILIGLGEPAELATDAATYVHGLQWALAPNLFFFALRSVFSALDRPGPTLLAGVLAVAVNAFANWVFIFGRFGFPALGVFGSGMATCLSQTVMLLILAAYAFLDRHLSSYDLFGGPWRLDWRSLAEIWRLGAPIGATIVFEVSIFAASMLLMGLIGTASLEAHAIVFQIASFAFMVPLGLAQAATVRVGHAFGARDRRAISRAGWAPFGLVLAFMLIPAAAMLSLPGLLISPFVDIADPANGEIVVFARQFLIVAALFQLFDGAQVVTAGMLRGLHDAHAPMLIALAGYWGVGLPLGAALAFLTPLGGLGLWIGLASGLATVATMLIARWRLRERSGFFREAAR